MPSVTRNPRPTREDRRAAVERDVLAATERLISEGNSFTELSVERLIREAGIARSTFYAYFDDKGNLVRRLTERVMSELEEAASTWWELAGDARAEDLQRAIELILETYARHEAVYAALVETATYDPLVAADYRGMMDRFTQSAVAVIERGQAAGVMRADLPPLETAGALTWMVERSAYELLREGADPKRLAEALAGIIYAALYP